jgi:hypothetical protein
MARRITFYCILLITISALIFAISNFQIIDASSINSNTHDNNKKNKDNNNDNSNTHDNNKKNKDSKDSTFSLPFNSNFADQSMKSNKGKNDIIPFP